MFRNELVLTVESIPCTENRLIEGNKKVEFLIEHNSLTNGFCPLTHTGVSERYILYSPILIVL